MDIVSWTNGAKPVVLDANNVLSPKQCEELRSVGCNVSVNRNRRVRVTKTLIIGGGGFIGAHLAQKTSCSR